MVSNDNCYIFASENKKQLLTIKTKIGYMKKGKIIIGIALVVWALCLTFIVISNNQYINMALFFIGCTAMVAIASIGCEYIDNDI